MKNEIKELKNYKKELKDYLLTIEKDMDIVLDKDAKKLYKETKKELKYIDLYIKQQLRKGIEY